MDRALDISSLPFYLRWLLKAICFSLSLSQLYNGVMSRILGSNRFSLSDVAVHTFLPNMT